MGKRRRAPPPPRRRNLRGGEPAELAGRLLELTHHAPERLLRVGGDDPEVVDDRAGPGHDALELLALAHVVESLALGVDQHEAGQAAAVGLEDEGLEAVDAPVLLASAPEL